MPQTFLDPDKIDGSETLPKWIPDGPLPPELRSFGYYPDISLMHPGDLILFSPVKLTGISKKIADVQESGGYAPDDARWTHAAVYAGAKVGMCEATRRGVHVSLLHGYVGKYLFRVRRDLSLDRETSWDIVVNALVRLNTPYSLRSIGTIFRRAQGPGLWVTPEISAHEKDASICSQLYAEAYSMATGMTLWNSVGKEVTPAYLSQSKALTDVALQWRHIGPMN